VWTPGAATPTLTLRGGFGTIHLRLGLEGGEMFTGVKLFSATKAKEREDLGEQVTRWLRANGDLEIVDRTVIQSSDNEFHCLTIVIFYRPKTGRS
jgi:hypothetical protein